MVVITTQAFGYFKINKFRILHIDIDNTYAHSHVCAFLVIVMVVIVIVIDQWKGMGGAITSTVKDPVILYFIYSYNQKRFD